jgi:hypothetical protein
MTKKRQQEILYRVNRGLEFQFDTYSWAHMIEDALSSMEFTRDEIEWAKEHTGYKSYIC